MAQDMTNSAPPSAASAVASVREQSPVEGMKQVDTEALPQAAPADDAFIQKERKFRKMQRELEAREQALALKEKQYSEEWMPKTELNKYVPRSRFEDDPLGTLTELGLDQDKLTQLLISGHNTQDPMIKALRAEIRAIKEAQENSKKQQEEETSSRYQQALKQIGSEVNSLVERSPEFEMIKNSSMQDAVVELIEQTWKTTGTLLDVEDAAKQVEEHLVEEIYKQAQSAKVQSRFKSKAPESAPVPPQKQAGMKTLTNSVTQDAPTNTRLTEKQRKERAMAAFYNKLNQ